MSTFSTSSQQSVSVFGQDGVDIDKATDLIFKQLQDTLNQASCCVRRLIMIPEQDDSFMAAAEIQEELSNYIDDFRNLMLELRSVSKQLLGVCPKAVKIEYKVFLEQKKKERADEKEKLKAERKNLLAVEEE